MIYRIEDVDVGRFAGRTADSKPPFLPCWESR